MKPEEKQLADYMSDLSERAYCASWMVGLEYVLWSAVIDCPRKYGRLDITDEHIAKLKELSDACGGWIMFDDKKGETFVPLGEWPHIYESNRNRSSDLVNDSNAAPNNSFNASGNSAAFIVSLAVPTLIPAALIRALGSC
jgi:hypothetical protein